MKTGGSSGKLPKAWRVPDALPEKLGECIDLLVRARSLRKAKEYEVASLQTDENKVKLHIIETFKKQEIDGARGKLGSVSLKEKDVPQVKDWDLFYAHIKKTNGWDLLQRRPGEAACQARWEENEEIPGVEKFHRVDITLNEVK